MDRPLVGEPLPMDLVDTEWILGRRYDLLDDPAALADWVAGWGRGSAGESALRETRAALRAALLGDPGPLNEVLGHGRFAPTLRPDGPVYEALVDDPDWELPWRAAVEYLDLLRDVPDRIRKCGNPDCILWFVDVSRNGGRRWCSMAGCGNRAKARAHYRQTVAVDP